MTRWNCPGWIFIQTEPYPTSNYYHTVYYGESGILYDVEIVDEKGKPKELTDDINNETGRENCLLLFLKKLLQKIGKVVVLVSGFCIIQVMIDLIKVGLPTD